MIVCVHQPNFLPWLGFFAKAARSDIYVVMDNVQFPKNCWTNRVKIAGNGEPLWLTVPVRHGRLETLIADIEIDHSRDWVRQHRATLEARYSRSPFFKALYPELAGILETRAGRLVELNTLLIRWVLDACGVQTSVVIGSKLKAVGKASKLVVAQCQSVGATAYVAGQGSADYEDMEVYENAGIQYRRLEFHHPEYPQYGRSQFTPGLSIVDALFNVGAQGVGLLLAEHAAAKARA
jgi:hypothetical protein